MKRNNQEGHRRWMVLALLFTLHCSLFISPAGAQEPFVRNSVVEEFTGTWCGNCPRGIVGMQRLQEDFGDHFIGIAVHTGTGEPMVIPAYPDVQGDLLPGSGAPSCAIDRVQYKFDPYSGSGERGATHYGIDADFARALSVPTEAKVELQAAWNDEYLWDVRYTVTTTFNINSPTAPYRLILVLTEDGLTGTDDNWRQVNYFSSEYEASAGANYQDDDMAEWRAAPYYVTGVVYDHVAVNTVGIRTGIVNSITAPVAAYEPQTYINTVTTLANHTQKIIQDKQRLHAIAILINTGTGEVVNAAKCAILPYGSDGIVEMNDERLEMKNDVYDLQGRRVANSQAVQSSNSPVPPGIYIRNGKKYTTK